MADQVLLNDSHYRITSKVNAIMDLERLKSDVWERVKRNKLISKGNHHYEDIQHAIYKQTQLKLSKDTIRNFMEGRNHPSPRSMDIYATFILGGDRDNMKTILDYQRYLREKAPNKGTFTIQNEVSITQKEYVELRYVIIP